MEIAEIVAEHTSRLAALDPLLPTPAPLPDTEPLVSGGVVAVASYQEAAAFRTWQPERRHRLDVRLAGDDHAGDLGRLLDRWLAGLDPVVPGDLDCAAVVELASRDTAALPALIQRGFVPVAVAAVRRASPVAAAAGVRRAEASDLAASVALNMEVVDYDARFGKVTARPETEAMLTEALRGRIASSQAWVVEQEGRVVGLTTVQLPPESAWVQGLTSASPVGYLETMSVTAALRGSGLGRAMVSHAHAALDAVVPVTLLHHALPNPLSTPFWYRHGYRPLWTMWQRRPAIPAG